ncbi:MAG TPA: hypothetical protein VGJ44_18500, partial [Kribbellaceae bacterium]
MNKRSQVAVVLVAAAIATLGWWTWIGRNMPADEGTALASGGTSFHYGLIGIRQGDEVYWLSPAPINKSDEEITLLAASPDVVGPGVEFIDARVYRRADFPNEAPPIAWGGKYSPDGASPARVKSVQLGGQNLAAGATMDDVIMLHLRMTTNQLPAVV